MRLLLVYCNRDFTEAEIIDIITKLRKNDDVHLEIQFDKRNNTLYVDKNGNVISSTDTGKKSTEAVEKYRLQKCAFDKEGTTIFDIGNEKIKSTEANISSFTRAFDKTLSDFDINTCLRKAHFLAQC